MREFVHSIAMTLTCALFMVVSAVAVEPVSSITFATNVVDLGVLSQSDDEVVRYVEYINTGTVPLVVLDVRTTCSCTTVKYERKKLMPAESGKITLTIDPSKAPVGNLYRVVEVLSTADNKKSIVTIKAVIQ